MQRYPDFFNDVFGPIMQPGSSSEFAGPCRIGNVARALMNGRPRRAVFNIDTSGKTLSYLVNFMSDRGYLGGLLGFLPDDARLFDAHAFARKSGISYDFIPSVHKLPSADCVRVQIWGEDGSPVTLLAESPGGGMIRVLEIDGLSVEWYGDTYAVLIEDREGSLNADSFVPLYREAGGAILDISPCGTQDALKGFFIQMTGSFVYDKIHELLCDTKGVSLFYLPALLPVVRTKNQKPQLFQTVEEWRSLAKAGNMSFSEAAFEYEAGSSGWSRSAIWDYFENIASIMDGQIHSLERMGYDNAVDTPLLPIYGKLWNKYEHRRISDSLTGHILAHAFSTNAKIPGVRIVPGPMGTGGGYLFSALDAVREKMGCPHDRMIESLAVAAGLGALAYTHSTASANSGCAGESGVCCAMAAGAITWMTGGDGRMVEHAASMALQANMGIPCDPIPGGLEFPCITRTFRAAVSAPMYADLALCGIDPLIPYHEMLQEIERNRRTTDPQYLCGPRCGCTRTPTAISCAGRLEEESVEGLQYEAE